MTFHLFCVASGHSSLNLGLQQNAFHTLAHADMVLMLGEADIPAHPSHHILRTDDSCK